MIRKMRTELLPVGLVAMLGLAACGGGTIVDDSAALGQVETPPVSAPAPSKQPGGDASTPAESKPLPTSAGTTPSPTPQGSTPSPTPAEIVVPARPTATPTPFPSGLPTATPAPVPLQFLMEDTYDLGERIAITIRNNSDETYTFIYMPCNNLLFSDHSGSFVVPEGTGCDVLDDHELKPGEQMPLLKWDQEECVKAVVGWCSESVAVKPGNYRIFGVFGGGEAEWSFVIQSAVVDSAIADLARRLDVPATEVNLERAERVSWPDTSLGCPQPGGSYSPVFTPGHLLILTHGDDEYVYHSDWSGPAVYCEHASPSTGANRLIQFGTPEYDEARSLAVDSAGNLYVAGTTGGTNLFVRKYDNEGNELWTRIASASFDRIGELVIDTGGNTYWVGNSVRKYGPGGDEVWTRELGVRGEVLGAAVDGNGDLYVSGSVSGTLPGHTRLGESDAFVRKYDPEGTEIWTRQFGSISWDQVQRVVVSRSGDVYVVGSTSGSLLAPGYLKGTRTFVRQYDADGGERWTREFGSDEPQRTLDVAVDRTGNLYLVGWVGRLEIDGWSGGSQGFVRKLDAGGNDIWTRRIGGPHFDSANAVAVDDSGNVYVVGTAGDALPGQRFLGKSDAFVVKYDGQGNELRTVQFGTRGSEDAHAAVLDVANNLHVAGGTAGSLPGYSNSGGEFDAFVVELSEAALR